MPLPCSIKESFPLLRLDSFPELELLEVEVALFDCGFFGLGVEAKPKT